MWKMAECFIQSRVANGADKGLNFGAGQVYSESQCHYLLDRSIQILDAK